MSSIDYAMRHEINLPIEHMGIINQIIDPASYIRLFKSSTEDSKAKGDKDRSKNEKYNNTNELNLLTEKLKIEQDRCKNLMSLSLIFREIKKSRYGSQFCSVRLNTMLTFELYITLSHHINLYTSKLEKLYDKQSKFESLTTEYNEIQEEIMGILSTNTALQELNDSVVKSLRPELLYELMIDYNKFTTEEHAKKCII